MSLHNLRIRTRLGLGFGAVALLLLVTALIAFVGVRRLGADIDLINKDRYVKIKLAAQVLAAVNVQARKVRNILIVEKLSERTRDIDAMADSRKEIAVAYAKLAPMVAGDESRLYAAVQERHALFDRALDAFLALARTGDMAAARGALLDTLRPVQLAYIEAVEKFAAAQERRMEETGAAAAGEAARVSALTLAAAGAGVLLALAAGWLVTRSITEPLQRAVAALRELEAGHLGRPIATDRRDELGEMLQAMARTSTAFHRVVAEVRHGVDSVGTASGQIAAGNRDLSVRTEQQASSLQQSAASMEEFSGSVRQSADHAHQASELAQAASAAARRGGEVVGQVVATMDEISASSRRIADIIGTIDGIAFQTNILALNAAVEAARAGEQGRGFAVVAAEVRALARRSGEAAREIKALIGASSERVEAGSRQAADAGAAMTDIVEQVRRVTGLVGEISTAAVEQAGGIGEVSAAISQMDRVTQQNAALVEQAAAAAQSLEQQARQLAGAVAVFKLQPV